MSLKRRREPESVSVPVYPQYGATHPCLPSKPSNAPTTPLSLIRPPLDNHPSLRSSPPTTNPAFHPTATTVGPITFIPPLHFSPISPTSSFPKTLDSLGRLVLAAARQPPCVQTAIEVGHKVLYAASTFGSPADASCTWTILLHSVFNLMATGSDVEATVGNAVVMFALSITPQSNNLAAVVGFAAMAIAHGYMVVANCRAQLAHASSHTSPRQLHPDSHSLQDALPVRPVDGSNPTVSAITIWSSSAMAYLSTALAEITAKPLHVEPSRAVPTAPDLHSSSPSGFASNCHGHDPSRNCGAVPISHGTTVSSGLVAIPPKTNPLMQHDPAFNNAEATDNALQYFTPELGEIFAKELEAQKPKRIFDTVKYNYALAITNETFHRAAQYPPSFDEPKKRSAFRKLIEQEYVLINNILYYKCDYRPLLAATTSNCLQLICDAHVKAQHKGPRATYTLLLESVYKIPETLVKIVTDHCTECRHHKPRTSEPLPRPLIINRTLHRLQIDLVDLQSHQTHEFAWVLRVQDCYSEFVHLWALQNKEAIQIANSLRNFFQSYGVPDIVQCDGGPEFKGAILILCKEFGIKFVKSTPQHLHSQGSAPQNDNIFLETLHRWEQENNRTDWNHALREISDSMNLMSRRRLPRSSTPKQIFFEGLKNRDIVVDTCMAKWHPLVRLLSNEEVNTLSLGQSALDIQRLHQIFEAAFPDFEKDCESGHHR